MAGRSQCVEVAYSHVIQRPRGRGNPQFYSKMASRFLCFGDSLTEVYSSIGCKFVGSSSAVSLHVVLLVVMAQIILSRPVSAVQVTCHKKLILSVVIQQGYTFAMEMCPYSKRLKELLSEHCKEPVEVS